MSTPAIFVIGDSLAFRAVNVKSERTGDFLPDAAVTYVLLDKETRAQVYAGSMTRYDQPTASFEGVIADSLLQAYDAQSNPNGIVPEKEYELKTTINNNGIKTSKARRLVAKLDPPDEEP